MRPGDYCINCRALESAHGGYDGSRTVAVNCGRHVWGNTYDESLMKREVEVLCLWLAKIVRECGYTDTASTDIHLHDDNHQFSFLTGDGVKMKAVRALSGTFGTDQISWTEENYQDSGGVHENLRVMVWTARGIREEFPAMPPEIDAPDGVVLLLEDRGGYFARSGDTWRPVTWKEFREYEEKEQARLNELHADDDWP